MRTGLDHLPQSKQRELADVVRILFEEFEIAHARGTQDWNRKGRIFKIVLYGSYARGDWVDDPVGGYQSDYDILVVVNNERLTEFEHWSAAEDRLMREVTINKTLTAPVSFIVHSLKDVNAQLERGRPFFVDIVEQGIGLYEAEGYEFAQPRNLPPDEARIEAEKHFDTWFESATAFAASAKFLVERGNFNEAAFNYHQATERFYHCALLVLSLYSPKSHRLNFLRSQCEQIAPALVEAWPRDDKFSRRCFELLRLAYVNARYSPHYKISAEELTWIGERVAVLEGLVEKICRDHIAALGSADRAAE
ncbi:nucleotidyltransferase and HEPN domain-containing protein [Sphingopyxis sp. JAI108]|uniref:nucleotidyltransferase and HEPN domain-containing protein n=1 Tax=Sphingopyxis sp. JAI108 TaxID=2723060 RepID=UPI0015CA0B05|nr:nucleotidyltransferase and HEPN domain-containing protein [Sphingopyxis sp. JAI108]NYF33836.1 putative nucleotidyltransferase/HEPN domain-containing protein [Sphingopyxis sp. JAI108]